MAKVPSLHPLRARALAWTFALAIAALAFGPGTAKATISFDLDTGNSAISGFTGPYATVSVTLVDPTHATITFTSQTHDGNIYLLGDGSSVAVNVNATTFTLGTITGSNAGTGFTPGPYSDGGSGNVNGFGVFNQTINSFDGFTHSSDTITFALTNTSGTWSGDANVLTANSNGALAAAHIFVTSSPANASNGALATGFAAGSGGGNPPQEVPAPPGLLLLASGVPALFLGRLLRRRKAAVA
jgi:hypothetical protein